MRFFPSPTSRPKKLKLYHLLKEMMWKPLINHSLIMGSLALCKLWLLQLDKN
jgi:hypothetical protein